MSVLDRIQQVHEKKKRHESAVSNVAKIVMALPVDERAAVMADIIVLIDEAEAEQQEAREPEQPNVTEEPKQRPYVDIALEYIQAHPEGVRTRDVAKAIGQDVSNADGTLRVLLKRGDITRDQKKRMWFPAKPGSKKAATPTERVTIRDIINKVFADAKGSPLSAKAIFDGAKKLKADINRSSVDGEIMRMKAARLLNVVGRAAHGGSLYTLSVINGGGHAAAAN